MIDSDNNFERISSHVIKLNPISNKNKSDKLEEDELKNILF